MRNNEKSKARNQKKKDEQSENNFKDINSKLFFIEIEIKKYYRKNYSNSLYLSFIMII